MMAMIASMETASITPQQQHTNTTNSSSNSSVALSDDITEWPSVGDGNENRKWQKSSVRPTTRNTSKTIWNGVNTQARVIDKTPMNNNNINNTNNDDEDENEDEELQYVLRMSQKDF